MAGYEVITKMTLKDTIAEVKEFAKAMNEFADTLEQIEKKYADDIPQENIRNCKTCERSKDGHSAGTEDCHLCMWESQYKPKKAQETVTEFADRCRECGAHYGRLLKKSEWEHDHEILKAYSDGASAVLDMIRAEIEERKLNSGGEPNRELAFNVCLQIIDKYAEEDKA